MTDFRNELDRMAKGIRLEGGALDRVRTRANRHRRTRQVTAGLVALGITSASVGLAIAAFRPDDRSRPAAETPPSGQPRPHVWPYGTDEEMDEMQRKVDEGQETWRRNPEQVARAFAVDMLSWEPADIETASGDDPLAVVISNPSVAEAAGAPSPIESTLFMERWRGRDDGILVITRAENDLFQITSPNPGDPVPPGGKVRYTGVLSSVAKELRLTLGLSSYSATSLSSTEPNEPSEDGTFERTGVFGGKNVREMFFFLQAYTAPGDGGAEMTLAVTALALAPPEESDPPSEQGETDEPVPGPTPTPNNASPAPVLVEVADGTGDLHATSYLGLILQDRGRGTHHGGYSIVATIDPATGDLEGIETTEAIDRTVISRVPGAEDEAERLRRLFFPDAEIRARIPGSGSGAPIEIHLGRDFLATEDEGLAVHNFVWDFLDRRFSGSRAERYLSPEALRLYESGRGGLSLYGYFSHEVGDEWGVRDLHEEGDGSWRAVVALSGDRTHFETLEVTRVSDTDITQWTITYAERNG